MVGKATKKKTLVDSTVNFSLQPASDMSACLAMVEHGKDSSLALLHSIFCGLQGKPNRQEQNRFFQSHKKKLKDSISAESWQSDEHATKDRLIAMLRLYLDPKYEFQTSLEWMLPALKDLCTSQKDALEQLAIFSASVFEEMRAACVAGDSVSLEQITYWMSGINGLSNLNHELGWLQVESAPALPFFSFLIQLTSWQARVMQSDLSVVALSSRVSKTMDDNIKCLVRNVNSVFHSLKTRDFSGDAAWPRAIEDVATTTSTILAASSAHLFSDKDILSATSTLFVSVFLFQRRSETVVFEHIVAVKAFSPLVQACLFKSFLHLSAQIDGSYLIGDASVSMLRHCQHHDCEVQLLGLQTMETWTYRLKEVLAANGATVTSQSVMEVFMRIIVMLITLWDHPVRQINHLVPSIFEKILRFLAADVLTGDESSVGSFWKDLFDRCMQMGSHYRGKYQALRIVLAVSGDRAVSSMPAGFVRHIVVAVQVRDIASAVSFLIATLCELTALLPPSQGEAIKAAAPLSLEQSASKAALQEELLTAIVESLCDANESLRKNLSDYVLPVVFKTFPAYALRMLQIWIRLSQAGGAETRSLTEFQSWALIQLVVHCRQLYPQLQGQLDALATSGDAASQAAGKSWLLSESDAKVVSAVLRAAYQSEDDDMRFSALTSLVASLKVAAPLSAGDFSAFLQHVVYSLKTSDAENIQHLVRILRTVLPRLKATASGEGGQVAMQAWTANSREFQLYDRLRRVLYPGITQDTEFSTLTLLNVLFDHFAQSAPAAGRPADDEAAADDVYLVGRLLQTYQSDWDKSRDLAMQMVEKLPCPWAGYDEAAALQTLVAQSTTLAMKAKLRESDAGAKLLRTLYRCYALRQNIDLTALDGAAVPIVALKLPEAADATLAAERFIFSLIGQVQRAMHPLTQIFQSFLQRGSIDLSQVTTPDGAPIDAAHGEFPLVHGLLLSLRLVVEVSVRDTSLSSTTVAAELSKQRLRMLNRVKAALLQLTQQCFSAGLSIVAEYVSDDLFAPSSAGAGDDTAASTPAADASVARAKGPINSATGISMAAVYVNTNTFTTDLSGAADATAAEADGAAGQTAAVASERVAAGLAAQRAIVAAWLLVKESAALFATLVDVSPTPAATEADAAPDATLLTSEEIASVAWTLLDALGHLKHMGAIAETHVALQTIVARILRFATPVPAAILQLPSALLESLLNRLRHRQQVFILRRSAGFAYSFLSILRAEPANTSAPLLHLAMSSLIDIVERGLQTGAVAAPSAAAGADEERSDEDWKLSVHALNVLRLVILDGAFSFELDRYIAPLLMLTIAGFAHGEWAVRNSSMMVFSAMVQKCVAKDKNSSTKGHTSNNDSVSATSSGASSGALSVSAREFFRRYPGVDRFLLQRLAASSGASTSIRDEHCLYPLLLLFAKFQATFSAADEAAAVAGDADSAGAVDLSQLADVIRRHYLGHASLAIRQVAARALSALVPIAEMPATVASLLAGAFPAYVTDRAQSGAASDAAKRPARGGPTKKQRRAMAEAAQLSVNELHGRLLVVLELLQVFLFYVQRNRYQAHLYAAGADDNAVAAAAPAPETLDPVGHVFRQLLAAVEGASGALHARLDGVFLRLACPALQATWFRVLVVLHRLTAQPATEDRITRFACGVFESYERLAAAVGAQTLYLRESFLAEFVRDVWPTVLRATPAAAQSALVATALRSPVKELREGAIDALLNSRILRGLFAQPQEAQLATFVALLDAVAKALRVETDAVLQERLWALLAKLTALRHAAGDDTAADDDGDDSDDGDVRVDALLATGAAESSASPAAPTLLQAALQANASSVAALLSGVEDVAWRHIYATPTTLQPRQCVASAMVVVQHLFTAQLLRRDASPAAAAAIYVKWLALLTAAADAENTQAFRLAAARALAESPLLPLLSFRAATGDETAAASRALWLMQALCLATKLLQDDDHVVRDTANAAAHHFLATLQEIARATSPATQSDGGVWPRVAAQLFADASDDARLVRALPPVVVS